MTLRLLLDQNFPRPPGFDLGSVDATVEAVHVFDHDPALTEAGTPDWLIYLRAVEDGFDALVTRDSHQLDQPEELWVLSSSSRSSRGAAHSTTRSPSGVTYSHTCRSSSEGSSGDSRACSCFRHRSSRRPDQPSADSVALDARNADVAADLVARRQSASPMPTSAQP